MVSTFYTHIEIALDNIYCLDLLNIENFIQMIVLSNIYNSQ